MEEGDQATLLTVFPRDLVERDVASLALSPRTINALKRSRFDKIGDLLLARESDLMRSKGVGSKAFQEVAVALSNMELCIGSAYRDQDAKEMDLALIASLRLHHFEIWTEENIPKFILNYLMAIELSYTKDQVRWVAIAPPGINPGNRLRELKKMCQGLFISGLAQGSTLFVGIG